jgi:hypothetical protein
MPPDIPESANAIDRANANSGQTRAKLATERLDCLIDRVVVIVRTTMSRRFANPPWKRISEMTSASNSCAGQISQAKG